MATKKKTSSKSAKTAKEGSPLRKAVMKEIGARIERIEKGEAHAHDGKKVKVSIPPKEAPVDETAPADGAPRQDHEVPSPKEVANNAMLAASADEQTAGKKEKKTKKIKADKPAKRVSAIDAAATVLAEHADPMRPKDMIAAMEAKGLWKSPGGKTPEASLYSAIIREIAAKGEAARFKKHDKGMFVAAAPAGKVA
jgi:hypothetical protein